MPKRRWSEARRQTVLAAIAEGCSRREAARRAGIDEGTLRRWLRRGEAAPEGGFFHEFHTAFKVGRGARAAARGGRGMEAIGDLPAAAVALIEGGRGDPGSATWRVPTRMADDDADAPNGTKRAAGGGRSMRTTKVFETHTKAADPRGHREVARDVFGTWTRKGTAYAGAFRKSIGEWKVRRRRATRCRWSMRTRTTRRSSSARCSTCARRTPALSVTKYSSTSRRLATHSTASARFSSPALVLLRRHQGAAEQLRRLDLYELRLREVGPTMYPATPRRPREGEGQHGIEPRVAARMRRALGNGTKPEPERMAQVITSDYIPTPEEVAAHQAETERQENEKIRINAEIRKEEGQRALEETS